MFLAGLICGGLILKFIYPTAFNLKSSATPIDYIISGLLVGFGTIMGGGCTSGHGVCGISRFSIRSIVATLIFMLAGIVSVAIFKLIHGRL